MKHEQYMMLALKEARKGMEKGEVPVGALVVRNGAVIGRGYNQNEMLKDPTAHAEMIAITAACNTLGTKWLEGCALYVTLEPCAMCAGAIVLARIPTLVFGSFDPKAGACGTIFNIVEEKRLNHAVHTLGGIMDAECQQLLKEFFALKRGKKGPA